VRNAVPLVERDAHVLTKVENRCPVAICGRRTGSWCCTGCKRNRLQHQHDTGLQGAVRRLLLVVPREQQRLRLALSELRTDQQERQPLALLQYSLRGVPRLLRLQQPVHMAL
jgi:hypothetical protein